MSLYKFFENLFFISGGAGLLIPAVLSRNPQIKMFEVLGRGSSDVRMKIFGRVSHGLQTVGSCVF